MNKKIIIIIAAVALLCAGGAGGAVWYFAAPKGEAAEADTKADHQSDKNKKNVEKAARLTEAIAAYLQDPDTAASMPNRERGKRKKEPES